MSGRAGDTGAWRDGAGYSLVEATVAAAVGATVVGLLCVAYLFAVRQVERWKEAVALESNAHLVLQRLWTDLALAEQVEVVEAGTWRIRRAGGDTVVYWLSGGVLTRGGIRVHAAGTEVTAARLIPSRAEAAFALPEAGGEDTLLVRLHLALHGPRHGLHLESGVLVRLPRPWRPLPPWEAP